MHHSVLSAPAARRHLHTRTIRCEGFRRDDGLWDIEAYIVDTKAYAYHEPIRGARVPGDHAHDMAVRLTLDQGMTVRAIEVQMGSHPYPQCQGAVPAYQRLVGATIGAGWRKRVNEAVGGNRSCTHVRELLLPMATVAFQTMSGWKDDEGTTEWISSDPDHKPYFIDSCKAWARDGEVVARFYPRHAQPAAPAMPPTATGGSAAG